MVRKQFIRRLRGSGKGFGPISENHTDIKCLMPASGQKPIADLQVGETGTYHDDDFMVEVERLQDEEL